MSNRRKSRQWNVLIITLDTTRADRLGCYGYRHAQTPTLDEFSRHAVRYCRCYTPVPLTLPGHCTLMTGLMPPRHGIHDNGQNALPKTAVTLAEILQASGYSTTAVVAAVVLDSQFGLSQGFETYNDDMSQGTEGSRFHYAECNAQLVTDRAIASWNEKGDAPQFMWVHYFDPHATYSPPGYDVTFAAMSGYDAEIQFVDQQLQRLLAVVDQGNRDTLVIVTADHGESLGEHGEQTHGFFPYDATVPVPLLVRFPDERAAGQVIETPVSLVDVMPSVLTWLGLDHAIDSDEIDGEVLPIKPGTSRQRSKVIHLPSMVGVRSSG